MTKTISALTALAFATALCGGAAAQSTGGATPSDKMASDHMMTKGAMKSDGAMKTGDMKAGAMKSDAAMKKPMKKTHKKPMADGAMATDAMAAKK